MLRLPLVCLASALMLLSACDSNDPDVPLGPLQLGEADIELSGDVAFDARGSFNTATDRLIGGVSYLFLSAEDEDGGRVFVYLYPARPTGSEDFAPPGTYSVCSLDTVEECLDADPQSVFATVDVFSESVGTVFDATGGSVLIGEVSDDEVSGRFDLTLRAGGSEARASGEFRARREGWLPVR